MNNHNCPFKEMPMCIFNKNYFASLFRIPEYFSGSLIMFYLKGLLFCFFIVFLFCNRLSAQNTIDDFAKQQEEEKAKEEQDKEKWIIAQEEEYKKFVVEREAFIAKMDSEFTSYLKQNWEDFNTFTKSLPENPKPSIQPKLDNQLDKNIVGSPLDIEAFSFPEASNNNMPILTKEEPERFSNNEAQFFFYGTPALIKYDENFRSLSFENINEENISKNFSILNSYYYGSLINNVMSFKNRCNLNDWGYYRLVKEFSRKVFNESENSAVFLTWFILLKSNYKVKLGYSENKLILLLPIVQDVFQQPYIVIDYIKYYAINENHYKNITAYRKDYPEAQKVFDLSIFQPICLSSDVREKNIYFGLDTIKIKFNNNLVNFYKDYPLTNLGVYFGATLSTLLKESIIESFKNYTKDMSEKEIAATVLRFIQHLPYKTDLQQFGSEKFMFVEEFFCYPAADCEDRAIAFTSILRELIKTPVIGLEYSDHVSCAVKFNCQVNGDYVKVNNQTYIVCDPTYLNAPVGITMPKYKAEKANVIVPYLIITNTKSTSDIWNDLISRGGNHGTNDGDIIFDHYNNAYVVGYYCDTLRYNGIITSVNNSNDIFVAKYSPACIPLWIKSFGGPGNDIGFNIRLSSNDAIYISGVTDMGFNFGNDSIKASQNPDVFVAKLLNDGTPSWIEGSGIQYSIQEDNKIFTSIYSVDGTLKSLRLFPENETYRDFGINIRDSGDVFFTGSLIKNGSLKPKDIKYNNYASFDLLSLYDLEAKRLSSEQYHASIIGIVAIMNLINSTELTVPGSKVQEVINQYNPSFKTKYANTYHNLGKIEFIRNNKGIITIRSKTESSVIFGVLKVMNESKFRFYSFNTGNAQVQVLNGISIGNQLIWYDINNFKIIKQSGDIIIDYGNNHSSKKMQMVNMLN